MAIDPMLYQKISGRSADPSKIIGRAVADDSNRKRRDDSGAMGSKMFVGHFKMRLYMGLGFAVVVLLAAVLVRVFR